MITILTITVTVFLLVLWIWRNDKNRWMFVALSTAVFLSFGTMAYMCFKDSLGAEIGRAHV